MKESTYFESMALSVMRQIESAGYVPKDINGPTTYELKSMLLDFAARRYERTVPVS